MNRALLLTDVVDSTALAAQLGTVAAAALWARHDRVARDLLVVHGGREIDKTDGFLLLFDDAPAAVAYAVAYHRALRDLGIAARAGLHVGPVVLTENAPADVARGAKPLEVDGVAKPVAARVMSVAVGGQTLLTRDALDALGRPPLRSASHGHWRLKGVAEPLELVEVGDDDAPMTPPPDAPKAWRVVERDGVWLPVREVRHHLPAERDAFVGREGDLRALADLLEGSRLVSVLGLGGTGKTRLVTRFAWTWLGDYPGGAWFCDLSEARSAEGICAAVAQALDVPLADGDPVAQLGHAIAGRGPCLVVLDNFEQVARHARETVGRWLDRARDARFVVTTREVLGLPGESALPLAPLVADDASRLFVARARQARPDFSPTDEAAVRALVTLLDGLPLAIELAAARVRVMPPKTLLERMSQRFKLLASTGGRHSRQATLRGALDWSWDLLSADEQSALAQLSVFEGGFTLEAAEGVLALDELWPTDAVQALVDKSLVRQVSDERFDLLVSVQEYAAEKLEAIGGRADAESRHGAWCAALGTYEALDALDTHGGAARRRALAAELDNVVAACRRAVVRADRAVAVPTLMAAWAVLYLRGPFTVGAELATAVLGMGLSAEEAARAGRVRGGALQLLGRMEQVRGHFDQALAFAREVGDRRTEGLVLTNLGSLHFGQGRMDEARALYEQALALHRSAGDRRSEGMVLGNLANVHADQGRSEEARVHYEQALALHREVGNRRFEGHVLGNLGGLLQDQGGSDEALALYAQALVCDREVGDRRHEGNVLDNLGNLYLAEGRTQEARATFEQALALAREVGDRSVQGHVFGNLGNLHVVQGRTTEAVANWEQSLAIAREVGERRQQGLVLGNLGKLQLRQGRVEEARTLLEQALAHARELGDSRHAGMVHGDLGDLHRREGRMDEARAAYAEGERLLREVGAPVGLARLLGGRARLEGALGQVGHALRLLDEAEALALNSGAGPDTEIGRELAKARAALETP